MGGQMSAGNLIHHMAIQQDQGMARDSLNALIEDWQTIAWRYADIQAIEGWEIWQGQQVRAGVTHGIVMRFYDLKPTMRLLWQGRIFNVVSAVNPGEQKRGTRMLVQAKEDPTVRVED